MSSTRQRNIPLGGRYRQVSPLYNERYNTPARCVVNFNTVVTINKTLLTTKLALVEYNAFSIHVVLSGLLCRLLVYRDPIYRDITHNTTPTNMKYLSKFELTNDPFRL